MNQILKLITFLIAFSSFSMNAQTAKWSQALPDNKKIPYMSILGSDDAGNFYVLRSNISLSSEKERSGFRNRSYVLQYFNTSMNLSWEKTLLTSFADGHISDVRLVGDHILVTGYVTDKKTKVYEFYSQYLDNKGNWIGTPVMLDSFTAENFDDENKPGLILSHDQAHLAFSYRSVNKEQTSQLFKIVVIDTSLSITYKKDLEIAVPVQLFSTINFLLTDESSFFILGIHYTTEKKIKAPDEYFYELYGYNPLLNQLAHNVIKSENKFLTDIGMTADNMNHSVVVAGFYSEKTMYSTAGIFYYALTEDSLFETKTIHTPFSQEYLSRFMGDKKESRELVNYSIDRLIVRKDGGVALMAESMYQSTRSYFDYYMQTYISHYYYHNGNIMILSVNPDGNILWNNVVTKDQNSVDDGAFYSSYISVVTDGRLAAIYNKYIEDVSSVLITYIGPDGTQKTDVLFNENEKVVIVPRSAKQIDDETVLIPAYKENKFYLVEISF